MPGMKVSIELEATIAKLRTELNAATTQFNKLEHSIKGNTEGIKQSLKSVTTGIAGIAAAYLSLSAAKGFVSFVIDINSNISKMRANLDILSGSQEKTAEYMDMAAQSAKGVVPDFEEFLQAIIKLKSFGLEPTAESLKAFGNLATVFDKSLVEVVASVNQASLETFRSLKQFGIMVKEEGDVFVVSFQGQQYEIEKNAKSITRFLVELGNTKFAGAMEAEAKTLFGQLDNLEDQWKDIARAVGEGGFTESMTRNLGKFNTFVANSIDSGIYKRIGQEMATGLDFATDHLMGLMQRLMEFHDFMADLVMFIGLEWGTLSHPDQFFDAWDKYLKDQEKLKKQLNLMPVTPWAENQIPGMPDFKTHIPGDKDSQKKALKDAADAQKDFESALKQQLRDLDQQQKEWDRLADSIKSANDPLYRYNKTMMELDALQEKGLITANLWAKAEAKAWKEVEENAKRAAIEAGDFQTNFMEALGDYSKQIDNWGKNVGHSVDETFSKIGDALTNFFTTGKMDWKNFEQAILQDWNAMFIKMLIINPLKNALFGDTTTNKIGGLIGGLFGMFGGGGAAAVGPTAAINPMTSPGFALGGAVFAGTPILVGERGPEIFMPDVSGRIIPNNQIGGAVTFNMTVVTPDANSFRKSQSQIYQDAFIQSQRAFVRNGG